MLTLKKRQIKEEQSNNDISIKKQKVAPTKSKRQQSKKQQNFFFSSRHSPRLHFQTLQSFNGNLQIISVLNYFLEILLPKDLIYLIYEYSKDLWDPYQLKSQYLIRHSTEKNIEKICLLDLNHLITISTWVINVFSIKENKVIKCLENKSFYCFNCYFLENNSILMLFSTLIKIYDSYTLEEIKTIQFSISLYSPLIVMDKNIIYYLDGKIITFNINEEKIIASFQIDFIVHKFLALTNEKFVVLLHSIDMEIWEKQSEEWKKTKIRMKHSNYHRRAIELDSKHLLFISHNNTENSNSLMEIWHTTKNRWVMRKKSIEWTYALRINSQYFVTICIWRSNELGIYESKSLKLIKKLRFKKQIQCLAKGIDQLIITFKDGTIEFWGTS